MSPCTFPPEVLLPRSRSVSTTLAAVATALTACASTPQVPAYLSSPGSCALVLGGGGTVFPDERVNQSWLKIDTVVTDAVTSELRAFGYHVEEVVSDLRTAEARLELVAREMAARKCNRLVQVSHFVESSASAPKFGFAASVLVPDLAGAERSGGGTVARLKGEFDKRYSYDLTSEVMRTLSMSDVGRTIAREIDKSGVVKNRASPARP
jgi:hypothetical protein